MEAIKKVTMLGKRAIFGFMFGYDKFTTITFYFSAFLILFLALSIGLNVLMRRVFGQPIDWVLDAGQYILVFVTFLAAPRIMRDDGHVRMTLVLEKLSPNGRNVLNLITSIIGLVICLVVAIYTSQSTWHHYVTGGVIRENIVMFQWQLFIIIPVGYSMLFVEYIRMSIRNAYLVINRGNLVADDEGSAAQRDFG
jgi:C4-dicarboxylate transporter DctQ subunit